MDFLSRLKEKWEIRFLSLIDIDEIQEFVALFNDFFELCEGQPGSARGILTSCPPSKNIIDDKFLLGIYNQNKLIGLLDLIQNYPENEIWTIGYLLIHPDHRSKGIGAQLVSDLYEAITPIKMRCIVQKQNEKALSFWISNGYHIVDQKEDALGHLLNIQYILEKTANRN